MSSPPNRRWFVHNCSVHGKEEALLDALCNGVLRIVTDVSHDPDLGIATAASTVQSPDGSSLTARLHTPGSTTDLQSHRAELSGHFAAVTVIKGLELYAKECNWTLDTSEVEVG